MVDSMMQSNRQFEKSVCILVMMIHSRRAGINFADLQWAFTATDAMMLLTTTGHNI